MIDRPHMKISLPGFLWRGFFRESFLEKILLYQEDLYVFYGKRPDALIFKDDYQMFYGKHNSRYFMEKKLLGLGDKKTFLNGLCVFPW